MEFRDEPAPRATVIVVGLREAPKLLACLDSVARSVCDVAYEVIVVLNDPSDALAAQIQEEVGGARTFTFRANLGFGGAVNFAAERARGAYIVLLNDDCVVTDGWLERLLEAEQRHERCAIVGSTLLDPNGTLQEAGAVVWSDGSTFAIGGDVDLRGMRFERRVDYCSGGSLLIRKDVWDQLEGFDEVFYPAYFEDVDFCLRAAAAGWEVWYQPLSVVFHTRWGSTETVLRETLWKRAHATFVDRWARLLGGREPLGSVERAVWRAMGAPFRVLVVGDRLPDADAESQFGPVHGVVSELAAGRDWHVTFCPTVAHGAPVAGAPRGVRVVDDLAAHLSDPGVEFDVVVVTHPHDSDAVRELLDRYAARAHRVYEVPALFHLLLASQAAAEVDAERRAARIREAAVMRRLELSLLQWADRVVSVSDRDADEIGRLAATTSAR